MQGTLCIQQHFAYRRMEIQSNNNASWGNLYVHAHKETPDHTEHNENYPPVRLEQWEGLSVHIQIPVVLPQWLLSPNLVCMKGLWPPFFTDWMENLCIICDLLHRHTQNFCQKNVWELSKCSGISLYLSTSKHRWKPPRGTCRPSGFPSRYPLNTSCARHAFNIYVL